MPQVRRGEEQPLLGSEVGDRQVSGGREREDRDRGHGGDGNGEKSPEPLGFQSIRTNAELTHYGEAKLGDLEGVWFRGAVC